MQTPVGAEQDVEPRRTCAGLHGHAAEAHVRQHGDALVLGGGTLHDAGQPLWHEAHAHVLQQSHDGGPVCRQTRPDQACTLPYAQQQAQGIPAHEHQLPWQEQSVLHLSECKTGTLLPAAMQCKKPALMGSTCRVAADPAHDAPDDRQPQQHGGHHALNVCASCRAASVPEHRCTSAHSSRAEKRTCGPVLDDDAGQPAAHRKDRVGELRDQVALAR